MKSLQLIIKKNYLEDILDGSKKEETREIRPNTASKYCDLDKDGNFKQLKKFDSLILHGGYNKNRPTVEVEVLGEVLEVLQDPDGKDIVYEHEGEEYLACNVVYELGKILNKHNC